MCVLNGNNNIMLLVSRIIVFSKGEKIIVGFVEFLLRRCVNLYLSMVNGCLDMVF